MNKELKLTESLQEALERSNEYALRHSLREINTETLIFYCIKLHLFEAPLGDINMDNIPADVVPVYEKLNNLSADDRTQLEIKLKSLLKKGKIATGDIDVNLRIPFSISLTNLFENAFYLREKIRKDKSGPRYSEKEIGIDDIMGSLLTLDDFEDEDGEVEKLRNILEGILLPNASIKSANGVPRDFEGLKDILERIEETARKVAQEEREGKSGEDDEDEDEKEDGLEAAGRREAIDAKKADPNSKTPALDRYAVDMTKNAKNDMYDPVVGRDKEIEQIIEILCCRKKNNAVLTGDPGCGKTAIIESLAMRIVSGRVPLDLREKRIFSLDLNSLVSGTQYRGQYEQRLQEVIKEVTTNKNIIIFIDEIHNLIGNGSSSGNGDGANILKPYLARGEFQCIGSTTTDEYRKFIEKDGALKRRFSPVLVEEPGIEDTIQILKGIAPVYGKFHNTTYSDEVIEKCVKWSGKYINDRFFPDKAISVLDMASSLAKLENRTDVNTSEVDRIEKRIEEITKEKSAAILESEFEKAAALRDEGRELEKKLVEEKEKLTTGRPKVEVTIAHISSVISKLSNVPIDNIQSSDIDKIRTMKDELSKKIIGQDEAVKEVTLALQRNIFGLRDPNKPIASFLFVGPTGTGKTLISKLVAKEFMGSENNLITIACSEYMQDWAESKLLGSAPGYVGYSDSEPRLYVLKRKPYSVILIDEVEKSSKNLYNIWLNMLEEGEITLSSGEKVSCKNSIIIFTGNVGTKALELRGNGIGFATPGKEEKRKQDVSTVMAEVKKEFRPEFLNRISKVVVFNSLGNEEMDKIFYLELEKLQSRIKEGQGFELNVSSKVKDLIVSKCEPQYGARSLQRLITEYIEDNVNLAMLDSDISGKTKIFLDIANDNPENITVDFFQ